MNHTTKRNFITILILTEICNFHDIFINYYVISYYFFKRLKFILAFAK